MNNDQQTSYHVATRATMTVARPPLADAYDAACLATRAAWDRLQELEADYWASFDAFRQVHSHDALIAQHAQIAQLRGHLDAAQAIWWRLHQQEHDLYVAMMEWWAARRQAMSDAGDSGRMR